MSDPTVIFFTFHLAKHKKIRASREAPTCICIYMYAQVALCYVALTRPPRHHHPRCFRVSNLYMCVMHVSRMQRTPWENVDCVWFALDVSPANRADDPTVWKEKSDTPINDHLQRATTRYKTTKSSGPDWNYKFNVNHLSTRTASSFLVPNQLNAWKITRQPHPESAEN